MSLGAQKDGEQRGVGFYFDHDDDRRGSERSSKIEDLGIGVTKKRSVTFSF